MADLVIDSEGRVMLPAELRERLHLRTGDRVSLRVDSTTASVEPAAVVVVQSDAVAADAASDNLDPEEESRRQERFAVALRAVHSIPIPSEGNAPFWDRFVDSTTYVRAMREEWEERLRRLRTDDEPVP